jgi:hypothetical protein
MYCPQNVPNVFVSILTQCHLHGQFETRHQGLYLYKWIKRLNAKSKYTTRSFCTLTNSTFMTISRCSEYRYSVICTPHRKSHSTYLLYVASREVSNLVSHLEALSSNFHLNIQTTLNPPTLMFFKLWYMYYLWYNETYQSRGEENHKDA